MRVWNYTNALRPLQHCGGFKSWASWIRSSATYRPFLPLRKKKTASYWKDQTVNVRTVRDLLSALCGRVNGCLVLKQVVSQIGLSYRWNLLDNEMQGLHAGLNVCSDVTLQTCWYLRMCWAKLFVASESSAKKQRSELNLRSCAGICLARCFTTFPPWRNLLR
jgi:hypothetical protein